MPDEEPTYLLRDLPALTGLKKRRLQDFVADGTLESELRATEFGTPYRVVTAAQLRRFLEARARTEAERTGKGAPLKMPPKS